MQPLYRQMIRHDTGSNLTMHRFNTSTETGPMDGRVDYHTVSSTWQPTGTFETTRTEIGELLYQLKSWNAVQNVTPLTAVATAFLRTRFVVAGLAASISVPPSDMMRAFQPVRALAEPVGRELGLPVLDDSLVKTRSPHALSLSFNRSRPAGGGGTARKLEG